MNTSALDPSVVWDRCTTEKARLARVPQLDLTCCRHLLKTPGLTPKVRGLPIECSFVSADGFSGRGARRKGAA